MNSEAFRRLAAPAFVFLVGLATICGAWVFQLVGGYVPCALCLQERLPYYIGVPLALVSLVAALARAPAWVSRVTLALAGIVFLYGLYLGTYHAGAEWSWWPGPSDCGGTGLQSGSTGDLLNALKGIRIVSCTEAAWRFPSARWGLSFAGWNAAISLALGAVALYGAARGAATQPHSQAIPAKAGT
ncbi:disulfide bond formation protein B [soil metagenome]